MPLTVVSKRTARTSTGPATRTIFPRPLQRIVDLGCDETLDEKASKEVEVLATEPVEKQEEEEAKTLVIKILRGGQVVYYLVPSTEVTEEYKVASIVRHPVHMPILQATESRWANQGRLLRCPFHLIDVTVYCYRDGV